MAVNSSVRKSMRFLSDEDGPAAVEYVFILTLIFVVVLTGITIFGEATGQSFQGSDDAIEAALSGSG